VLRDKSATRRLPLRYKGERARSENGRYIVYALEDNAHLRPWNRLHFLDFILVQRRGGTLVALEEELDVLRGDGLVVAEARVLSKREEVEEMIRRFRSRLGQGWRAHPGRHRLYEGVMHAVLGWGIGNVKSRQKIR
jgi:hypothetical protein